MAGIFMWLIKMSILACFDSFDWLVLLQKSSQSWKVFWFCFQILYLHKCKLKDSAQIFQCLPKLVPFFVFSCMYLDCQLLKHVHMVSLKKATQSSLLTSSPGINHSSPEVLASAAHTPMQCVEVSPGDQWLVPKQHRQWISTSSEWRRHHLHPF